MTDLDVRVRQGFNAAGIPLELVEELLEAFAEAKRRFYRDDLRPSEIEGARFSEAVFRILEWATTQAYTPLGGNLPKVPSLMGKLEQVTTAPDSVRFHIPRTLRLIYDVRNKRDVAHLGDGIDPNQQDATMVVRNMEWVLAELVRLYHSVSATEAHGIIVDLVSKDVPLIQVFNGIPRVLKQFRASDHFLVLLYWRGTEGATLEELKMWARAPMRAHIKRTLDGLDSKDLIHLRGDTYVLTYLGEKEVEKRKMLEPQ
ncbi:hypothetical protein [Promicromonospora panici]|uniref:hypothetical protein n=1 Tax=Promicromonospora panici TaxID=2219658 RepID=UPI00101C176D|nr:hypothetical protein [Promicromonospora panici]